MATERNYILKDTALDDETARLALLEEMADPFTIRRLGGLSIAPGSRCLEVGAGRGSIPRWLSERVGPDGHVVAADIDPRFLTSLPDNVEVRTLDIGTDDLEPATYDVVHCRSLLLHLPDPRSALRRMATCLCPGGSLLAEEPDFGLMSFGGHPDGQWSTELNHRIFAALAAAKVGDAYFGRMLPGLVVEAGLELIGTEHHTLVSRAGELPTELHRLSMAGMAQRLVSGGLVSEADLDRLYAMMGAPSTVATTATQVAVWGRRPA
jgi:2-polyprenyl-3-methyl-5-hydroxy-6-metoxy-1,4-benzoquinol methylase